MFVLTICVKTQEKLSLPHKIFEYMSFDDLSEIGIP